MENDTDWTGGAPALRSRPGERDARLLAATAAVLHRYTGRTQLRLGYLVDGAPSPLALALDLSGQPTFAGLSEGVQRALADADGIPTDELDAVLAIDLDPPAGGPPVRWLTVRTGSGDPALALHEPPGAASDEGGGRLAEHVGVLLQAASADPDRTVAALPVLSAAERDQLLDTWNATAAPYPPLCLHELVATQTRATPDAVAVVCGAEQLTYAELDARANQLAHHLGRIGVGPEVLVGICVERSLEMLVGLLGILKAGGAYVPIDPAYPVERQQYMLASSQAPVILTQARLRASLPDVEAAVVCLDADWPAIAQGPSSAPEVPGDPEQLAYVIYTSGSTGRPKGVQIPHRALVNFLTTMRETPGMSATDVLVAVTTLSFDIAGLELYLPLITGARVVIAPAATAADPRALAELLTASGATVMQATPTTWRMLLDSGWAGGGLKALCGGEALPLTLADRLVAAGVELWNMYGPTETTIWSTCARIATRGEPLSIGRPIANTTLYILDAAMAPVPVGVAGELWIGGDGLARGYRGRPDLTEERFVPHPFDATPGARIYRTGDLARYRSDGSVMFLGRIDHQVKVRGFRIELGEIETVLGRHPAVREAVVVARGSDAEAELAAYVIAAGEPAPASELRRFLGEALPAYMVPATVTTLERFPLTPNGKVDRQALPEPSRGRDAERELVAAATELERRLAATWERELAISPIGVTDNFFDLGVSSVVAAQLFAAIEHELGENLPLGAIFRAPTIRELAALLEAGERGSRWTSLVPIQTHGSKPPIFCIHGGAGTILHLMPLARRLGPDQPFYALQSSGLYGGSAPIPTVEAMATHYLAEMKQVHPGGPWRLAGYCFGTIVAFELAQRLRAAGEEVELVAMFNGPSPAWIKQWGWYGNQPSIRAKRPRPVRVTRAQRIRRALREPRRLITGPVWELRERLDARRARLALARRQPIPERVREEFFFGLHARAERAYEASVYPGEVLVFSGAGLYEDPELGWGPFAGGGVRAFAVPGEHTNNRQAMHEPAVGFVAEQIEAYLAEKAPAATVA
jgi:amino acid adenylation domain-containing protein